MEVSSRSYSSHPNRIPFLSKFTKEQKTPIACFQDVAQGGNKNKTNKQKLREKEKRKRKGRGRGGRRRNIMRKMRRRRKGRHGRSFVSENSRRSMESDFHKFYRLEKKKRHVKGVHQMLLFIGPPTCECIIECAQELKT